MPIILILIFVGIPVLEIAVFIQAGSLFGLWPTLAAIVATAILGGALIRAQGLITIERARESLNRGQAPVQEVFTGICLLLAGALLLTPGFLTDSIGFLLLVPPLRRVLGTWLIDALIRRGTTRMWVNGEEIVTPERHGERPAHEAIDVEFTEVPPDEDKRPPKE